MKSRRAQRTESNMSVLGLSTLPKVNPAQPTPPKPRDTKSVSDHFGSNPTKTLSDMFGSICFGQVLAWGGWGCCACHLHREAFRVAMHSSAGRSRCHMRVLAFQTPSHASSSLPHKMTLITVVAMGSYQQLFLAVSGWQRRGDTMALI